MDDILNLAKELKTNEFAKNNPNWRLCGVHGNTELYGQREAAARLAKFLPLYGQWTIEAILNAARNESDKASRLTIK